MTMIRIKKWTESLSSVILVSDIKNREGLHVILLM